MTDLDLLTGAIAAQLRLLEPVTRLYPARTSPIGLVRTAVSLLDAVADDPTVTLKSTEHGYLIETDIGINPQTAAPDASATVHTAIRRFCTEHNLPVQHIRIRISSID